MKNNLSLDNSSILIHLFNIQDSQKQKTINFFLKEIGSLCDYRIKDLVNYNNNLSQTNVIGLFIITNPNDFEILMSYSFSELTVKIITYFLNPQEFESINNPGLRSRLKALGFRLVCPETWDISDLVYASPLKVFDTIYMLTERNKFKFKIKNLGNSIQSYTNINPQAEIATIKQLGWLLRDRALNHSDSFSGGIALRFGKGALVTASRTDKYHIISDRICYVEDYNSQINEVSVAGELPPSSESGVFHEVFKRFPSSNIILHFHYKAMTCSSKLAQYKTLEYVTYGGATEAKVIADKFQETEDFAIAYGHGEFILAKDFSEVISVIDRVEKLIE